MTSATIYLVHISRQFAYDIETEVALEAFDSLEKAEAFLMSMGMQKTAWGDWTNPEDMDYEAELTVLEVK